MRAFHFLRDDMKAGHGSEPPWAVGEKRVIPSLLRIAPCQTGYHSSPTLFDALFYAPGNVACLVEIDDDAIAHGAPVDKYASRSRKLLSAVNIERELRLFTADCAENVLYLFEQMYPYDKRPREAIQAARDYAEGRITKEHATNAAFNAAYAATYAAFNAAANDARKYHRERFQQIEDYVIAMAEEV